MAAKEEPNKKSAGDQLEQDYDALMSTSDRTTVGIVQWKEDGDVIEQYSFYEEYTPVITSSETSLNG